MNELPFIDEHSREVAAPVADTWAGAHRLATGLAKGDAGLLGRVLGTEPASGFEIVEADEPQLIAVEGRHRFARYRAEFLVEELAEGSLVGIRTLAEFPGAKGRVYKLLVIGSRGHVVAVRWFLNRVSVRPSGLPPNAPCRQASDPGGRGARRA